MSSVMMYGSKTWAMKVYAASGEGGEDDQVDVWNDVEGWKNE